MIELYFALKIIIPAIVIGGMALIAIVCFVLGLIEEWRDNHGKRK